MRVIRNRFHVQVRKLKVLYFDEFIITVSKIGVFVEKSSVVVRSALGGGEIAATLELEVHIQQSGM